ncbi:MAG: PIG-L family deacetylase [Actinobacteria bacterium]|nr:PIG-L family deacetylase [Actinomycetota bacterium]
MTPGPPPGATQGEVRAEELEAAMAVLGVQHARCLHFHDGTLADLPA